MTSFDEFVSIIHSIKSKEELSDFLYGMTSEEERAKLIQRVAIVRLLLDGQSQQSIAKQLGVGVATVTRGSKELHRGRFTVLRKEHDKETTR